MAIAAARAPEDYLVEADSSARRAVVSAILWLAAAVSAGLLLELETVFPGLQNRVELLAYGRVRALHDTLAIWAWLTVAGFGAVFAIVPRVAGIQLHNERLGRLAVGLWNTVLFAGVMALLFGANQGRMWAELPGWLDVAVVAVLVLVAYNAAVTLARRAEKIVFVSGWYLVVAAVFLPLVYPIGNLRLFTGFQDAMANAFYVQAIQWLWLIPMGIGAVLWLVPNAIGAKLYSKQIAAIGFWTLLASAGWTGQRAQIWGPAPAYVQTIAIAGSFILLVPTLSVMANVAGTLRGRWAAVADDFGLRFAATGVVLLVIWTALQAVSSERGVARIVGSTLWEAGLRHLAIYGVFSSLAFAFVYHMFPRLSGRAWYSRRLASLHFWATLVAVIAGVAVKMMAGLLQTGVWLGVGNDPARFGETAGAMTRLFGGFNAVGLLAFVVLAVGQYAFVWNAVRSSARGEPVHLTGSVMPAARSAV